MPRPRQVDEALRSRGIVMYTTARSSNCRHAKRVFASLGVPYTEVKIAREPRAAELVRRLNGGMQSVPTILFPDGSRLVEPSNPSFEAKLWPFTARPR